MDLCPGSYYGASQMPCTCSTAASAMPVCAWVEIRQFCKLPEDGQSLMRAAMSQLNLSARAYHRTRSVKLARTIADLARCEENQPVHLAEALQYRPKLLLN